MGNTVISGNTVIIVLLVVFVIVVVLFFIYQGYANRKQKVKTAELQRDYAGFVGRKIYVHTRTWDFVGSDFKQIRELEGFRMDFGINDKISTYAIFIPCTIGNFDVRRGLGFLADYNNYFKAHLVEDAFDFEIKYIGIEKAAVWNEKLGDAFVPVKECRKCKDGDIIQMKYEMASRLDGWNRIDLVRA